VHHGTVICGRDVPLTVDDRLEGYRLDGTHPGTDAAPLAGDVVDLRCIRVFRITDCLEATLLDTAVAGDTFIRPYGCFLAAAEILPAFDPRIENEMQIGRVHIAVRQDLSVRQGRE